MALFGSSSKSETEYNVTTTNAPRVANQGIRNGAGVSAQSAQGPVRVVVNNRDVAPEVVTAALDFGTTALDTVTQSLDAANTGNRDLILETLNINRGSLNDVLNLFTSATQESNQAAAASVAAARGDLLDFAAQAKAPDTEFIKSIVNMVLIGAGVFALAWAWRGAR